MHSESRHEFHGYPLRERVFVVCGKTYRLIGPANYESLVDDPRVVRRFEQDEFMPYWAEFWPASLVLAERVGAWPTAGDDAPRVLELGCGLGLVSLVAAARGYRVVASDYEPDALAFVEENARRNTLPAPELRFVDWRRTYPDLRVERIVASDVLYETRCLRPVAE
ncbi:MAG: methyltransferase domain-containing protein, partial [Planctomycetota bacterium]